jgi:large subunit ribosomal protein L6e
MLVTGPYKVNGVPLRRVPQSYVIATQTKVDVSKVKIPDTVNDDLFKKPKSAKKKDDELFFEKEKESSLDESRKALQQQVDSGLMGVISKTPLLKAYIASKFSLKNGKKPHEMTF